MRKLLLASVAALGVSAALSDAGLCNEGATLSLRWPIDLRLTVMSHGWAQLAPAPFAKNDAEHLPDVLLRPEILFAVAFPKNAAH